MKGRGSIFHDMRSSLNGVICMGSLLEETELTDEQIDILKYMLLSAEKTLTLINEFQNKTVDNDSSRGSSSVNEEVTPPGNSTIEQNKTFSVLVAEDDYVSRLYLTTLLRRQNWHIDEACDGLEALELFEKNNYQLILMDVSMPGVDGIQAAQKIRSKNKDIPILAITAHGESELQEDFIQAGMSDVLRKPIHDEFLLSKIRSLCSV
ncbi:MULTISPECIES: response regulator [unclassified Oceanispirochaeta]|uniref:response regulator n=1 Tax=unclassified Oceanispirochaeta TaxID=2635722 RepID=UPI000E0977C0|nr:MULTISPECIES: response regulator [unclassified Oceanispirochaeta]MBF9014371.1 response regulator [Oceanispirochaeta sp. M2]NPD71257.1 response regulator [Oceanispirochaeta sp. M1]RDG33641.1 response regulator [Oceanispirochaeta sp. M1]